MYFELFLIFLFSTVTFILCLLTRVCQTTVIWGVHGKVTISTVFLSLCPHLVGQVLLSPLRSPLLFLKVFRVAHVLPECCPRPPALTLPMVRSPVGPHTHRGSENLLPMTPAKAQGPLGAEMLCISVQCRNPSGAGLNWPLG